MGKKADSASNSAIVFSNLPPRPESKKPSTENSPSEGRNGVDAEATLDKAQYETGNSHVVSIAEATGSFSVDRRANTPVSRPVPVAVLPRENRNLPLLAAAVVVALVGVWIVAGLAFRQARDRRSANEANQPTTASDQAISAPANVAPSVDATVARSAAYLDQLAATVNQNQALPKMVEDYMQEMPAQGSEGVFTYRYKMVMVLASEFDGRKFFVEQRLAAMKTQCGMPQDTGNLVQQGVTVRYVYFDKLNAKITSFDITSYDCP